MIEAVERTELIDIFSLPLEDEYEDFNREHFLLQWLGHYASKRGLIYTNPHRSAYMGVISNTHTLTGENILECQFLWSKPEARTTWDAVRLLQSVLKLNTPSHWKFTTANKKLIHYLIQIGCVPEKTILQGKF